jgi:hypothetical protein
LAVPFIEMKMGKVSNQFACIGGQTAKRSIRHGNRNPHPHG